MSIGSYIRAKKSAFQQAKYEKDVRLLSNQKQVIDEEHQRQLELHKLRSEIDSKKKDIQKWKGESGIMKFGKGLVKAMEKQKKKQKKKMVLAKELQKATNKPFEW